MGFSISNALKYDIGQSHKCEILKIVEGEPGVNFAGESIEVKNGQVVPVLKDYFFVKELTTGEEVRDYFDSPWRKMQAIKEALKALGLSGPKVGDIYECICTGEIEVDPPKGKELKPGEEKKKARTFEVIYTVSSKVAESAEELV